MDNSTSIDAKNKPITKLSEFRHLKNTIMELHNLCTLFPEMVAAEFDELVTDMKLNGFRKGKEIITLDGKILEGRNRFNAAQAAGIKPKFKKFDGKDPLDFVVAENFNRRHLTSSQRAMIAADISTRRNSDVSTAEAAQKLNVSRDSAQTAKKIKKASPALAKKVKAGNLSLHAAEKKIAPIARPERPALDFSSAYTSAPAPKKDIRTTGQICHEAFIGHMGIGESWEDLKPKQRAAWQIAADSVKGKI